MTSERKMKVSLALSLVIAMIFVLAACSGGNNNNVSEPTASVAPSASTPAATKESTEPLEEVTLTLAGRNDDTEIQEKLIALFTSKYPHIKVDLLNLDGPTYETILTQNKAAGTVPDVGFLQPDFIERFINDDIIAPIPAEAFEAVGVDINDINQTLRDGSSKDGQMYLVPRTVDTIGVFVNKTMFQNAGLDLPTDDWTWEQFVDTARKLTIKDGSGNTTQYGAFMHNAWEGVYHSLWLANGGQFVNAAEKKVNLSDPKVMRSVQAQIDLIKEGVIADDMVNQGNPFLEGKAAMWFHIQLLATPVDAAAKEKGFDWDVVSYPQLTPVANQLLGFVGYFLSKDSKHPKEAAMLAAFVASTEAQTEIFSKKGIPALDSVAATGEWEKYPIEGKRYKAFNAHPDRFYFNNVPTLMSGEAYGALHGGNRDALTAVIKGEKSLVDAYTALEQTVNDIWAK